jgi:hypothetical protein
MSGIVLALLSVISVLEVYPAPQSAYMHEKKLFTIESILPVVTGDDGAAGDALPYLAPLYNALGYEPTLMMASRFDHGQKAIYIGIAAENTFWEHRSLRKYAPDPNQSKPETYYLTINGDGIFLAAVDMAGLHRGVYTLAQIVSSSLSAGLNHRGIPAVPYVEIRDYPDLDLRAAYLHGPVTSIQIQAYAALNCNMLIFESEDFYALQDDKLVLWQGIFREAKAAGITPVPVFQLLNVPEAFLRQSPAAVEGRSRIERLKLVSDDWAAFSKRNLIVTPENPIRVVLGETVMQPRRDYMISEGDLESPFAEKFAAPWMLRRIPGGAIPDGSVVTVTYSYAPPYSSALCPHAPETRDLVQNALATLINGLNPSHIHCGGADIARLNQDLRCRDKNNNHGQTYLAAITLLHNTIAKTDDTIRMMLLADALLPHSAPKSEAQNTSLHTALADVPRDILLVTGFSHEDCAAGGRADAVLQWLERNGMPAITAVAATSPAAAYRIVCQTEKNNAKVKGIILTDPNPLDSDTRAVLGKAWSLSSQQLPWPEGLNDFFESTLWKPEFSEIKAALAHYLDSRILAGEHPEALRNRFSAFLKERGIPSDGSAEVVELFDRFTRYLELEYDYARGKEKDALRGIEKLLRNYGDVDLEMDEERLERIRATVSQQQLFPPAPILIGRPLAYYRPCKLPAGIRLYETPAQVAYNDERGATEATFDFLTDCGGIYRVDFETVNAQNITLYASNDGVTFKPTRIYSNTEDTGETIVKGPVFPSVPLRTRYLRLRVESQTDQAVLREVRAFSWKTATRVNVPPFKSASADAADWPDVPGVTGFLHEDGMRLATGPTAVNLARDKNHLFIGIMAEDPMPHATGVSMMLRDAPLWQEESIEVRIRPKGHAARRFLVNPLGAQYDGMTIAGNIAQWDDGWDAEWRVQTEQTTTGWTATLMLPFSILGGIPESRDEWDINFIRHRNNVQKETSAWAVSIETGKTHYGTLVFE